MRNLALLMSQLSSSQHRIDLNTKRISASTWPSLDDSSIATIALWVDLDHSKVQAKVSLATRDSPWCSLCSDRKALPSSPQSAGCTNRKPLSRSACTPFSWRQPFCHLLSRKSPTVPELVVWGTPILVKAFTCSQASHCLMLVRLLEATTPSCCNF